MLITTVLIAISLLVFCASENNETDIESQQNFYCEIQEKRCNNLPHPLCSKFNATELESENYKFLELSSNDIDLIVNTINTFRNDLASNLQDCQWSADYARLLHYHIQYKEVCMDISIDGRFKLYQETFQDVEEDNTFYHREFLHRVINGTKKNSPQSVDIYREEFDRIGCVYYEDHDYLINHLVCYTNGYGLREGEIEVYIEKIYKYGEPCTGCDEGGCSEKWPNLCDPVSDGYLCHHVNIYFISFCIWSARWFDLILNRFY